MATTSTTICNAAEQLKGFVGYNHKTGQHLVRFSEDAFGLDVEAATITPANEFVWLPVDDRLMVLKRGLLQILLDQHIDDRLNISPALHLYMRRDDLPEITAHRQLKACAPI